MRRITFIYQRADWPGFRWDAAVVAAPLAALRHRQGVLQGRMEALGTRHRAEATLQTLTKDGLETSEIEGERLDPAQVRASFARRLGLPAGTAPAERRSEAIAAVVLDATQNYAQPLTAERLFAWHRALFPDGGGGRTPLTVGAWRTEGEMIVASGPPGREVVHFQAPPAADVPAEMARFLAWFEDPADPADPVLKACVAHVWFVTVHPFDDGNGRIGRAIADMMLARSEGTGQRFYSLSARLRLERAAYYQTLEATQKGGLDITPRLLWFLGVLDQALADAETTLAATVRQDQFWQALAGTPLNPRQRLVLGRLLDGFEGKLTSSKWAKLAKCSQDTALRDVDGLVGLGVLVRDAAGGRSVSYSLTGEPPGST